MAQNSIFTRKVGDWSESPPGKAFARAGTTDRIKELYVRDAGSWKNVWNFFIGTIVPDSDVDASDWTPTPLYLELNEDVPDDATTEIDTIFTGNIEQVRDFEVGLSNPIIPPTGGEVVTLRARFWLELVTDDVTKREVKIELRELTSIKKTINTFADKTAYVTTNSVLSQAEKDSISNWNNVRVRITYTVTGDSEIAQSIGHVTWIELEFA